MISDSAQLIRLKIDGLKGKTLGITGMSLVSLLIILTVISLIGTPHTTINKRNVYPCDPQVSNGQHCEHYYFDHPYTFKYKIGDLTTYNQYLFVEVLPIKNSDFLKGKKVSFEMSYNTNITQN